MTLMGRGKKSGYPSTIPLPSL